MEGDFLVYWVVFCEEDVDWDVVCEEVFCGGVGEGRNVFWCGFEK